MRVVRCVLSGSFRRDFANLERDYHELVLAGCQVLSPHRLDFADPEAAFVKDRAEADLSPAEIEKHHLLAVRQADFVWLHCPEGYIGPSAALEIGYAMSERKPIFSKTAPSEPGLQPFVTVVPSVFMALQELQV
jgi:hypothetical protein